MSDFPEPSFEELQWTIVMARKILSNQISIQVPPNLNQKHLSCLTKSGIDDFGGISPVTIDHVNPEAHGQKLRSWKKFLKILNKSCFQDQLSHQKFSKLIIYL